MRTLCERSNQIIWRICWTIKLLLHSEHLSEDLCETVLPDALHAVRSLACPSTNETPHEPFLRFHHEAMAGSALPSWLLHPGPVLLCRHVRNKGNPLCDPVELVEGNQTYSVIRLGDGQESAVSTPGGPPFCAARPYVFCAARQNFMFFVLETWPSSPPALQLVLSS